MNHESAARLSNNFGALRLLLAYMVILSHSPELVDGNRSREVLTRMFGTLSFGELAVDFFFVISGFLITASFLESRSGSDYLVKRVLRIYPAYLVAYLLCTFALAPLVGGQLAVQSPEFWLRNVLRMLSLGQPFVSGPVFDGNAIPLLNGAVWTIRYEFGAYLIVLAAGSLGVMSKRVVVAGAAVVLLVAQTAIGAIDGTGLSVPLVITPVRLFTFFVSGAMFYLYRDRVHYSSRNAIVAAGFLLPLMLFKPAAEPALVVFGAYLMFYFAFAVHSKRLAQIGTQYDLSYGVYLYGWPVTSVLIWHRPDASPWAIFALTVLLSSGFALLSWITIERPAVRLKSMLLRRLRRRALTATGDFT